MVSARISRQSAEVVSTTEQKVGVHRLDAEVAGRAAEASAGSVLVSRQSVEVVGKFAATVNVSRLNAEVAGAATTASGGFVQISRQSAEVVVSNNASALVSRLNAEVAGLAAAASTGSVLVSRQSVEAVARRGSAGTVVPLALANDSEIFLHDWADQAILRSSYLTDISTSPSTAAESRRSLALKPERSLELVWRQTKEEFDENDFSRLDRLFVFLRRITDQRFQAPLVMDQRELNQAYLSTDDTIFFDTSRGRWFPGARIVIVQLDFCGRYESKSFHTIDDLEDDRLILSAQLGVDVKSGSVVIPVIDCEVSLEAEMRLLNGCLGEVSITVNEIAGTSQLPPTRSDIPAGMASFNGYPILDVDPDWSDGVKIGRSRSGIEFRSGRSRGVSIYGFRSAQTHELSFVNERPEYWNLVELFDTRRGRARSFYHIDHDHLLTPVSISTVNVEVEEFGDLTDFKEEFEGGFVGIKMRNGDHYVREAVTIQLLGGAYRITVSPALPAGLQIGNVVQIARARYSRLDSDEMEERWFHTGLADTSLKIRETLEEKNVEL